MIFRLTDFSSDPFDFSSSKLNNTAPQNWTVQEYWTIQLPILNQGVPQSSVLAAVWFNIATADLNDNMPDTYMEKFADDASFIVRWLMERAITKKMETVGMVPY